MKALFVASDRREVEPWVACWQNVRPVKLPVRWARTGLYQGQEMLAIANGIGQERAASGVKAAVEVPGSLSGVWSIGTAGALDPALAIADVIAGTEVTDGGQNWQANAPAGPAVRAGLIRTSQHIARTSVEKTNLHATGAIIVEMEAAAVARVANEMAVPFYCVRVVSDLANETFFIDFESFFMTNGTLNVPRLMMYALAHPMDALPELIRLQRRSSLAAKRLAGFLAACHF
jgi:adenosylhomocysteine nucleosidase